MMTAKETDITDYKLLNILTHLQEKMIYLLRRCIMSASSRVFSNLSLSSQIKMLYFFLSVCGSCRSLVKARSAAEPCR